MKHVYFKSHIDLSAQSTFEYALLVGAIALLTVFASQFLTSARTAAELHRDTAVQKIVGPSGAGL